MTESEKIEMCLNCNKEYCDDCLADSTDRGRKAVLYMWNGKEHNIKELAKVKGIDYYKMRRRVKSGGVNFAMSDFKTKKQYDIAQRKEKAQK